MFPTSSACQKAVRHLKSISVHQIGCQCFKSTKSPKTSVVGLRYDGMTRVPVKTVSAAKAVKKLNFENLSLFGPLLKSTSDRMKSKQMGFRMTYADERIPRRVKKPKLACEDAAAVKVTVTERGYRTLPDVEYSDAIQSQQHESIKLDDSAVKMGNVVDKTKEEYNITLSIPEDKAELKATLRFPIFNFVRDESLVTESQATPPSSLTLSSKRYPSVTAILRDTMDEISKQKLEKWKQRMIAELGEKGFELYQELLLSRGRSLHKNIYDLLCGQPSEALDVAPENQGHWESLQCILPEIQDVRFLETAVSHPHLQYRGIVDCVAKYRGELVLIDWKTSSRIKSRLSQTYDNPLQAAAYVGALNFDTNYDVQVKHAAIVIAYEDGHPCEIHWMGPAVCESNWQRWLRRLGTYWNNLANAA